MNEVNGGDNAFVRCVFVSVFVCLCVRSGRSWELNANCSKTVKATDFKFYSRVPRHSPDMTSKNFPNREGLSGSRDPLNFWALNANSCKTVKATEFKFDICVPMGQSGHDTHKFSQNVASLKIYLAEICTLTSAF